MTPPARLSRFLIALGIAFVSYFTGYRPLQINWGATEAEIARPLPGDDVEPEPLFNATRAVTVAATPDRVWPWVAQVGSEGVGWYSYDAVDNGGRQSAVRVLPDRQHSRGDLIPLSKDGSLGFTVEDLRAGEWMLFTIKTGGFSWVFSLHPQDDTHTRLISRIRMRGSSVPPIAFAAVDAGDFVMLRQMMVGIRDRAEGRPIRSFRSQTLELLLWVACFIGFVVAEIRFVTRQRFVVPAIVSVGAVALTIALVVCQPPIWVDALGAAAILGALAWDGRSGCAPLAVSAPTSSLRV
jgi:hypothetical protein